ncbi:UNVERIFIED_CONTAM: aminotransferase class I/II-fold pyridoxal phosphate-dependent enzyme, partial [Bacillus amyloliquefaciens DSM 7 = ATCC 23350]
SKGLYSARKAIVHYYQNKGLRDITVNDVYIGNGVSELIAMSMQALLNDGDEILIPAPDYPLWTAAATLAGGPVRHYLCDEETGWFPNLADM